MSIPSAGARPGLRRVLDALGRIGSELEAEKRKTTLVPEWNWRAS